MEKSRSGAIKRSHTRIQDEGVRAMQIYEGRPARTAGSTNIIFLS